MTFPERYDLLVILAGDKPARHPAALELIRRGWADYLTVTGQHEQVDPGPELAVHLLKAPPSRNTYEDALSIKALVKRHGFASVLVLTSAAHATRARLVLRQVLAGLGVRVDIVTWAPVLDGPPGVARPYGLATPLSEIIKTVGYRIRRRA